MNLLRKFNNLKLWQKLGLAISILSIMKIFVYHNFIIDVQAESSNNQCVPYIVSPETGLPIEIALLQSQGTYSNVYNTNFQTDQTTLNNLHYYSQFNGYRIDTTNNNEITDTFQSSLLSVGASSDVIFSNSYITSINITDWSYYEKFGPFKKDTDYFLWFEVIGGSDIVFNELNSYQTSDFTLSGQMWYQPYANQGYYNTFSLSSYIDIKNISWETCIAPGGNAVGGRGYIKVHFKTNSLFPETNNGTYLKELTIGVKNINESNGQPLYGVGSNVNFNDFKFFIANPTNASEPVSIGRVWGIMEASQMELGNGDAEFLNGTSMSNQIYENCDTLDIACHIRNISKGIQNITSNLIFSLKQFLSYIFIPDFSRVEDHMEQVRDTLEYKIPDVMAFFDYIEYFMARFGSVQANHTISFNGVKVPGYNTYLINPFTFNFDTIINDPLINPYYVIARVVMTVIIALGSTFFIIRVFQGVFHDVSLMNGGGN